MTLLDRRRIARLIRESKADWIVLIGSWARGTQTAATSDIDVVVGGPPPARHDADHRMHIFYLDDAQLEARIAAGDDVAFWFLKFGVPLSGAARWRVLRKSLLDRPPPINSEKKFSLARRQLRYADDLLRMGDLEAAQEELHIGAEHLARGILIDADHFPASRPEVPNQLRSTGYEDLARLLETLRGEGMNGHMLRESIRVAGDLVRHHSATNYARRLRSDRNFIRKSDAAEKQLKGGPPWFDEISPREFLEEAHRQQP
ncbi:MAG TPA: nucleotidyltransferase domain-containing protein [Actinomycetota bacterium]|nr:nucleotidyltransferase domain-containing protein [Actinomycetota bacterium]